MSKKPLGYDTSRTVNNSVYWKDKPENTSMLGIASTGPKRRCHKCNTHKPMAGGSLLNSNKTFVCKDCKEAQEELKCKESY